MREIQRAVVWMGGAALSWCSLGQGCLLPETSNETDAGSRRSAESVQVAGGKGGRIDDAHGKRSEDNSRDADARVDAAMQDRDSTRRAANSGDAADASAPAMASAGTGGQIGSPSARGGMNGSASAGGSGGKSVPSAGAGSTATDPCSKDNGGCDTMPMAACTSRDEMVSCDCPAGYEGSGVGSSGCVDIDECAVNNGNCDTSPMAACHNLDGATPTCTCPTGSTGNGVGSDGCSVKTTSGDVCGRFTCEATIVHDPSTMLAWQRNLPMTYPGCMGRYLPNEGVFGEACSWDEANAFCAQLGMGWRLPTMDELRSIRDMSRTNPSIDTSAFPNTPSRNFWSATVYPDDPTLAWEVSFEDDSDHFLTKKAANIVRCVRVDGLP